MPPPRIHAGRLGALLARLKAAAPQSVWLAADMLYRGDDTRRIARLADIAADAFVPLIAVNDVLYHEAERRSLQDVVTCIREHLTLETAGRKLEANAERHLKSAAEMARLFRRAPEAIGETCAFSRAASFRSKSSAAPNTPTRPGRLRDSAEALVAFAEAGLKKRYPNGVPPKVRHALSEELRLIGELNYAPFFLTVDEIVKFARSRPSRSCARAAARRRIR